MLKINEKIKIDLKKGERAAQYSSLINLFLAIIKGIVGFLSGSIALIADSIHSFSDIFASLAVYIGLKLSRRKPDEKFPYGYYKVETFASLIVSALIIITGVEIAFDSFNAFLNPSIIEIPLISLFVAALSVVISFLLARYKEKIGREIGSHALINDGKHSFVDILSSLIVFIGILCSYIGYLGVDGISGIFVALLIVYIGLKLAKDDVMVLLDASMDPEKIKQIRTIAEGVNCVEAVHDIKIRRSGPFIFVELHLETQKGLPVKRAYEISNKVREAIKDEIQNVDSLTVQIEPFKKEKLRIAVPVENKEGMKSAISKHFNKAPYILIADVFHDKVADITIRDSPWARYDNERRIKVAEFLRKEKVDILVKSEVMEDQMHILSDELMDIIGPDGITLEEIIKNAAKKG